MSARHRPGKHTMSRRVFRASVAGLLIGGLLACGGGGDSGPVMSVDSTGASPFDSASLAGQLASYPLAQLSGAEADSLVFMRQEEQLAHDVYAVSATLWTPPVFANITASEATHSAAVKALLDRYQLTDPLAGLPNGSFKAPAFQALYDALVLASRVSALEAVKVGLQIEELDIRDITQQLAAIDNPDILTVYGNLVRGSRNHLRAFMKVLTQMGGTYVPRYISQTEFDAIVNTPVETGG